MAHPQASRRSDLPEDLRVPPGWGGIAVLLVGLIFVSVNDPDVHLPERLEVLTLTVLFYLVALLGWLLSGWRLALGRWFLVAGLALLVHLGLAWVGQVGFLSLVALPILLAQALIGLRAALAITLAQGALVLALPTYAALQPGSASLAMTLAALGATFGLVLAITQPMQRVTRWSFEHYWRAQRLLDDARERKAELQQVQDELMHANWQLELVSERLAAMRLSAEEARRAKEDFVAKVSHEFRTPLNMIIGLTDLLLETPEVYGESLPGPLLEDLGIVQRNCAHLTALVDDVLNLSRVDAGFRDLQREPTDLREHVATAREVVAPLLRTKRLAFEIEADDDLPLVHCDPVRIRQVILNLVSNAARFTRDGGIAVAVRSDGDGVTVRVTDTGPGLSPADAARIFDPFFQSESAARVQRDGTGLGLSISKQFVELHGGRIWVESAEGRGSTFAFRLPLAPPAPAEPRQGPLLVEGWEWRERPSLPPIPRAAYRRRVVVCDETGGLAPHLARDDETEILEAATFDEALRILRDAPAHAFLVNTRPATALARSRAARHHAGDTPVLISAFPDPLRGSPAERVAAYLTKPVTLPRLATCLERLGNPRRILVVDDNADVRRLLPRMLRSHDPAAQVATAASGEEALTLLRRAPPELLLLDLELPGMDGWELLERARAEPSLGAVPTVVVSALEPASRAATSPFLLAAAGAGMTPERVLRGSRLFSELLLGPARPAPHDAG